MAKLDQYVLTSLSTETNTHIKCLQTKSLLTDVNRLDLYHDVRQDVIASFLQDDSTHLNFWGYEALINDLTPSLSSMWGSRVGGRMWSVRRMRRKKIYLRKRFGRYYDSNAWK